MAQDRLADAVVAWRGMTREQYDALVETGLLEGEQVELLEGVVVTMVPQGEQHTDVLCSPRPRCTRPPRSGSAG